MANVRILEMQERGLLQSISIPFSNWVKSVSLAGEVAEYDSTIPKSMKWSVFYTMLKSKVPMGFDISINQENAVSSLLDVKAVATVLTDTGDPWEDLLLMNSLTSEVKMNDTNRHRSRHGWIGIKPFDNGATHDDAPYYFKFITYGNVFVYDVVKGKVDSVNLVGFEYFLDSISREPFEFVDITRSPSVHVALTPIFEVVGEVNLAKVIRATRKEDKLANLRLTVSNLGLQSRSKAAGDMAEVIQETLHEIAEHNDVGDVLMAINKNTTTGSLVLTSKNTKDAYTRNQQIGILARESGGVVVPTTPLLSSVKDVILVKPIV